MQSTTPLPESTLTATSVECQATTIMTSVDTMTGHTWRPQRTVGAQTPSGPPLSLPTGWSVQRLVRMALDEPMRSTRALALAVSRGFEEPLPGDQFSITELVLQTCCETIHQLLNEAVRPQLQCQGNSSTGDAECRRQFEIWANDLRNRADGYYGPHFEPADVVLQPTPPNATSSTDGTSRPSRSQRCRTSANDGTSRPNTAIRRHLVLRGRYGVNIELDSEDFLLYIVYINF